MALNVQRDNSLFFAADIDESQFEKKLQKMEDGIKSVLQESIKVEQTMETIRAKIYARKDLLLTETELAKIKQYNQEIKILQDELFRLQNIGVAGYDDFGKKIVQQLGLIDQMREKLTGLYSNLGAAQSAEAIAAINQQIQLAEAEFTQLTNAGRKGFDSLGNAIVEPLGLMEELQVKAGQLRESLLSATTPEEIVLFNQELVVTNAELARLKNAGLEGFDNLGNKLVVQAGLLEELQIKANGYKQAISKAAACM